MNFRRAWAYVVGHAEATAPLCRSHAAGQRREQRLRVGIRNRQNRNLGDRGGFFDLQALGVFRGANARRERVTWIVRHVRNAAPLNSIGRAEGAGGRRFFLRKTVFVRNWEYYGDDKA